VITVSIDRVCHICSQKTACITATTRFDRAI